MVVKLLLLAGAGGLGTIARYGLSTWMQRFSGSFFPVGTLTVNLIGSFLFALFWAMVENRIQIAAETRLLVLTGFMGAFTTFSTMMFETSQQLRDGQFLWAISNLSLQNGIGLLAILLGIWVGRIL